jgi:Asp-tRNA(Asn)/Glu-tRNA(Gln) amidotransferase A subunit family amidase
VSHPQDLPLRDQAAGVASGELDPAELLAATLARIEERDPPLNSVVDTFPEQSERMLREAPPGPLHGVPVAVKDMWRLPWRGPRDGTSGEHLPPGESGIYLSLRDAGAVVVGVTNMHLYGGGSTGHQSAYGPVRNPWDPSRVGGGSSGGSAASVSARLVGAAVGDDGGGSIRLPSAYCGITGLKSTFGAVSRDGFTFAHATMTAAGPMCRDAADARLFGEVLQRRELPVGDGSGLRVGIVRSPFWENVDPEVETACQDALAAAGWESEEIMLAGAEHTRAATVLRLTLESFPDMSFDDLPDADAVVLALLKYELLIPARWLVRADRVRSQMRRSVAEAFGRCDLLAWPSVPAPAPAVEDTTVHLPDGPMPADPANVRQTGLGNLTGIPGINVPVGTHSSGLPMGLQLQAAWGGDSVLLDAAEHIERATERAYVDALPPVATGTPA